MIYLSKILPIFFLPLGITFLLVLVGLARRQLILIWTGILILWFSSTPVVGTFLLRSTERWAERMAASDISSADAIVVLSAGRTVAPGRAMISEWQDPDRFFGGIELFDAGKAPLLVFTGGWVPWEPNAPLEGDVLAEYARKMGIPSDRIITTGRVATTADEVHAVAALLRVRQATTPRVIVVTSAFHMPRAQELFERAGLAVTAFPVDFRVPSQRTLGMIDFLPSPGALGETQTAIRELYGRVFYRVIPF